MQYVTEKTEAEIIKKNNRNRTEKQARDRDARIRIEARRVEKYLDEYEEAV